VQAASPTLAEVQGAWPGVVEALGEGLGSILKQVQPTAIPRPNLLVIALPPGYNWVADRCDTQEGRVALESALRSARGWDVRVRFERAESGAAATPTASTGPAQGDELAKDPMVQKVIELFEARAVHVEAGDGSEA